ncbi:MAG: hypothetical protein ACRD1G_05720, partial [Acidimicrobiales bacterium]
VRVSGQGDKNSVTYGASMPLFSAQSTLNDIRCVTPFVIPRMSFIWPDPSGFLFAHVHSLAGGTDICGVVAATIVDLNLYERWLSEQAGQGARAGV